MSTMPAVRANSRDHTMKRVLSTAVTRREFLGSVGAVGVVLRLGAAPLAQAASDKKIPVGLQLYSVREQCKIDLPGTVAAVSKIGYRGVEFAGYHGRSAKELRQLLDDNGLVACGTTRRIRPCRAIDSRKPSNSTARSATSSSSCLR